MQEKDNQFCNFADIFELRALVLNNFYDEYVSLVAFGVFDIGCFGKVP